MPLNFIRWTFNTILINTFLILQLLSTPVYDTPNPSIRILRTQKRRHSLQTQTLMWFFIQSDSVWQHLKSVLFLLRLTSAALFLWIEKVRCIYISLFFSFSRVLQHCHIQMICNTVRGVCCMTLVCLYVVVLGTKNIPHEVKIIVLAIYIVL